MLVIFFTAPDASLNSPDFSAGSSSARRTRRPSMPSLLSVNVTVPPVGRSSAMRSMILTPGLAWKMYVVSSSSTV